MMRVWVLGLVLTGWAGAAGAEGCPADRTPIEMAGHLLCLPTEAMPSIDYAEDGAVKGLVWSHPERLPAPMKMPNGTSYLIVSLYPRFTPASEQKEPSDLPQMLETRRWRLHRHFPTHREYYPLQARLHGKPFVLECSAAIAPVVKGMGADDCELVSQFAPGIWLEIQISTVEWSYDPAWPRLDETWVETWPPYLTDLETGLNNLFLIQN